jgi:hypothetical protein
MKRVLLFILHCLAVLIGNSQNHPLAKEILDSFYARYNAVELQYPSYQLEKRNHSWYIYALDFQSGQPEKTNGQQFYDAVKQSFLPLVFNSVKADTAINADDMLPEIERYQYDLHPSYGYDGWYKDVIQRYSNEQTLSANELNSLARAYSNYAASLLAKQFGNELKSDYFNPPLKINALTEMQLKKYIRISDSAIFYFDKLAKSDPSFQTRVGSIQMKVANERVVQYHAVLTFAQQSINRIKLPEQLYPNDTLQKCRQILEACPTNAIFLSFGDNDFYPILYLQAIQRVRPDVHLINYNLLAVDRYIFKSTTRHMDSKPIQLSFDTVHYRDDKMSYFLFADNEVQANYNSIVKSIKSGSTEFPTRSILLNGKIKGEKTLKYPIRLNGNYILKEQVILLDLLNNLKGRKFCASNGFDSQLEELNRYFKARPPVFMFDN